MNILINHGERKKNRLQNYDYSQDGWYFTTICTKNREEIFGEIKNNKMIFNGKNRFMTTLFVMKNH